MRSLLTFLGKVQFAIFLISSAATFVILGTFIESHTNSHLYASAYIYNHPLFLILMGFFFINILLAALSRYPFKKRHIPFLITHLGLLMVLAGGISKGISGVQGNMGILEGSGSHQLMMLHTHDLVIERKSDHTAHSFSLKTDLKGNFVHNLQDQRTFFQRVFTSEASPKPFSELDLQLRAFHPHSQQETHYWIKNNFVEISGLPPIPLRTEDSLTPNASFALFDHASTPIYAANPGDTPQYLKQLLIKILKIKVDGKIYPLEQLISEIETSDQQFIQASLSVEENFDTKITLKILSPYQKALLQGEYHLTGELAGQYLPLYPEIGHTPPLFFEIVPNDAFIFTKEAEGDEIVFWITPNGKLFHNTYPKSFPDSLLVYEKGFGGYAANFLLPITSALPSQLDQFYTKLYTFQLQITQALEKKETLNPAFDFFLSHTQTPIKSWIHWIHHWSMQKELFPTKNHSLPWEQTPKDVQQGCYWGALFLKDLQQQLDRGKTLHQHLKESKWPFRKELQNLNTTTDSHLLLPILIQQIFSIAPYLPEQKITLPQSEEEHALWMGIWFTYYHMDPYSLFSTSIEEKQVIQFIKEGNNQIPQPIYLSKKVHNFEKLLESPYELETPLHFHNTPLPSLYRLEDNHPLLQVYLNDGVDEETLTLRYDPFAMGLKFPALKGKYLLRFQPKCESIPFHVRLRDVRQISYPLSNQAFGYEAKVLIQDRNAPNADAVAATLSMNQVYETPDGYRFYLANLTPPQEIRAQQAQLVVNYDPTKYLLTYPGAFFIGLGILGLFWLRKLFN